MSVREKPLTRTFCSVKHLATSGTHRASTHKVAGQCTTGRRTLYRRVFINDPLAQRSAVVASEASLARKAGEMLQRRRCGTSATIAGPLTLSRQKHPTSPASPPLNTSHTTPESDSTGPPDASPRGTHEAPADKPPTPSPLRTASALDKVLGSAPADQSCP